MSRSPTLAQRAPGRKMADGSGAARSATARGLHLQRVVDPSAALLQLKGDDAKGGAKAEDSSHVFAGPAVNDRDDVAAAGISHGAESDVVLVQPRAAYAPPPGWDLDCFLYRDGWATKFAGATGLRVALFPALAQQLFGQYFTQATALFARTPVPTATPTPGQKPTAAPAQPTPVQRLAESTPEVGTDAAQAVHEAVRSSAGTTLPTPTRRQMEGSVGTDLGGVRVHTGPAADRAAKSVAAKAFTTGKDVYFRDGQYQPDTPTGKKLLAHELAHTAQQGRAELPRPEQMTVSQPGDTLEREADAVANRAADDQPHGGETVTPAGPAPALAREAANAAPAVAVPAPTAAPAAGANAAAPGAAAGGVVPLRGGQPFEPSPDVLAEIAAARGRPVPVQVALGSIAAGPIQVRKVGGMLDTQRTQMIPLTLPVFANTGISPVLAVNIENGIVQGYATVQGGRGGPTPGRLFETIRTATDAMGWIGFKVPSIPQPTNKLEGDVLTVSMPNFPFRLGGFLSGTGTFGFANETVTFNASATVNVPHLEPVQLAFSRGADGKLAGEVDIPVQIAKFSGRLHAKYENGVVDARGRVGYESEKFSGAVELMLTDAETARNIARSQLPPDAVRQPAGGGGGDGGGEGVGAAPPAGGAGGAAAEPGPRAVAGSGELDFRFTEWMTGKAQVIVDGEGNITVVGEIRPPAEVELFAQRDYVQPVFPPIEIRAAYGLPVIGNVFVFANISMDALAKLGPGKLYNIVVTGRYSTDPDITNEFSISGSLNISAFAGLRLRAEGGAGIRILKHDLKFGVGIEGLAGVRGYIEARPTLGYREKAEADRAGNKGEFYLKGHLELAAQPFLGLSGDLFVELDSPWWSPAPDKKWTWPLGSLEYPLPGEIGIGADIDYVIGSSELPNIEMGEVQFDSDKFMTDLMDDHVPPKRGAGQETPGQWTEEQGAPPPAAGEAGGAGGGPAGGAGGAAQGQQAPGEGQVPAVPPGRNQDYLSGLEEVSKLAEESKRNPLTLTVLSHRLAAIKSTYHFTELRPVIHGTEWDVVAAMSPPTTQDVNGRLDILEEIESTTGQRPPGMTEALEEAGREQHPPEPSRGQALGHEGAREEGTNLEQGEQLARNKLQGDIGEEEARQAVVAQPGVVYVRRQVRAHRVQGGPVMRVIDHLLLINGEPVAAEIKSGNARFDRTQDAFDLYMATNGAYLPAFPQYSNVPIPTRYFRVTRNAQGVPAVAEVIR